MKMWMDIITHGGDTRRTELNVNFLLKGEDLVLRVQFAEKKSIEIGVNEQALQDAINTAPKYEPLARVVNSIDDMLG